MSLVCLLYKHLALQTLFRPRWAGNFLSNVTQEDKKHGSPKNTAHAAPYGGEQHTQTQGRFDSLISARYALFPVRQN
jgi:hypothetical protein